MSRHVRLNSYIYFPSFGNSTEITEKRYHEKINKFISVLIFVRIEYCFMKQHQILMD